MAKLALLSGRPVQTIVHCMSITSTATGRPWALVPRLSIFVAAGLDACPSSWRYR